MANAAFGNSRAVQKDYKATHGSLLTVSFPQNAAAAIAEYLSVETACLMLLQKA